jgi:hypothetical protein
MPTKTIEITFDFCELDVDETGYYPRKVSRLFFDVREGKDLKGHFHAELKRRASEDYEADTEVGRPMHAGPVIVVGPDGNATRENPLSMTRYAGAFDQREFERCAKDYFRRRIQEAREKEEMLGPNARLDPLEDRTRTFEVEVP